MVPDNFIDEKYFGVTLNPEYPATVNPYTAATDFCNTTDRAIVDFLRVKGKSVHVAESPVVVYNHKSMAMEMRKYTVGPYETIDEMLQRVLSDVTTDTYLFFYSILSINFNDETGNHETTLIVRGLSVEEADE